MHSWLSVILHAGHQWPVGDDRPAHPEGIGFVASKVAAILGHSGTVAGSRDRTAPQTLRAAAERDRIMCPESPDARPGGHGPAGRTPRRSLLKRRTIPCFLLAEQPNPGLDLVLGDPATTHQDAGRRSSRLTPKLCWGLDPVPFRHAVLAQQGHRHGVDTARTHSMNDPNTWGCGTRCRRRPRCRTGRSSQKPSGDREFQAGMTHPRGGSVGSRRWPG